jgi:hypothetical protein
VLFASVGATGFYGAVLLNYAFELIEQIALFLVIGVGFWVGGWLFLILRLQKSDRAAVKALGEALGGAMTYTAIFQGIIYTVLVFMVIGYTIGGADLPESRTTFIQDLLVGAGYIAAMVFGAAGATVIFTYYRPRTRLLAAVYGLVGVAMPLVVLLTGWLRTQVIQHETLTLAGFVGFTLLISVLLMTLMATVEDPSYQRKAELRRRLKKN